MMIRMIGNGIGKGVEVMDVAGIDRSNGDKTAVVILRELGWVGKEVEVTMGWVGLDWEGSGSDGCCCGCGMGARA